jgi:hypothetical protein
MALTSTLKYPPNIQYKAYSSCIHFIFQNSKYVKIPLSMNFSFSTDFKALFPQIGQKEHALEFH